MINGHVINSRSCGICSTTLPPPPPPPPHPRTILKTILRIRDRIVPLYLKHCNGIFVNNYLLTGNKVQLYFTEMNSRYFKHCNGIVVSNDLLTGKKDFLISFRIKFNALVVSPVFTSHLFCFFFALKTRFCCTFLNLLSK